MFDLEQIRKDFPALDQKVNGKPLVYFDNGATTLKPNSVIDSLSNYYRTINSNIHRGAHYLSNQATAAFEDGRKYVAHFINAREEQEIIFTRGTTESINLLAHSFAQGELKKDDEIIITALEHHANIVPWQMACEKTGAKLRIAPLNENREIDLTAYRSMLSSKTKLVAIAHISNVLGLVLPIKEMTEMAHELDIPVMIDGAQAAGHDEVNVQYLDCEFYCFSAHKAYGPMGIGVLYGKREWLEKLPPYQGGGEMIDQVSFEKTTYNEIPFKFEAGTPNVGGVVAMKTALQYLSTIGFDEIGKHEAELTNYLFELLASDKDIEIIGDFKNRASTISFRIKNIHHYDAGTILDKMGIAVRTGHHCAQPLMQHLDIPGTIRASLAFYNSKEEIDIFAESLKIIKELFA